MAANAAAAADNEPVDVLFALHEKFDILDFAGPLQVLSQAQHDINNPGMPIHATLFCPLLLLVTCISKAAY